MTEYEQIWAQHQALIKELMRISNDLQIAEKARIDASQMKEQDNESKPDLHLLDAKVEQLRTDRDNAATKLSEFEFRIISANKEFGAGLENGIHPELQQDLIAKIKDAAQVVKDGLRSAVPELVKEGISNLAPDDYVSQGQFKEVLDTTIAQKDAMLPYASAWIHDKMEKVRDTFSEKDAANEWQQDIDRKEQALLNDCKASMEAIGRNSEMLQKQIDAARGGIEAEKKLQELEPKQEIIKAEVERINARLTDEMNKPQGINAEKQALQNALELTKNHSDAERILAIEKARQEFDRKRSLEGRGL